MQTNVSFQKDVVSAALPFFDVRLIDRFRSVRFLPSCVIFQEQGVDTQFGSQTLPLCGDITGDT